MNLASTPVLEWLCKLCGSPIGDKKGALHLDPGSVTVYRERYSAWRKQAGPRPSLTQEHKRPVKPSWQAHHDQCRRLGDEDYFIAVESLRTSQQLMKWTVAMWDYDWFPYTNWPEVMLRGISRDVVLF